MKTYICNDCGSPWTGKQMPEDEDPFCLICGSDNVRVIGKNQAEQAIIEKPNESQR